MKRNRAFGASLAVIALSMSACSDGGTKTLSSDDFADSMDDICRTATSDLEDLDPTDGSFIDDILDIIDTGLDDLGELTPPDELQDDFDDFVSNLEDQRDEFEDLGKAIEDGDADAIAEASQNLADLDAEADELADSLGANRCQEVGVNFAGDVPDVSIPDVTIPDVTIPDVTTPDVSTPNTPLPIDTTPLPTDPPATQPPATQPPTEMTEPPMNPEATGEALDASEIWAPPAGYEWGQLENLPGILTPSVDPTIAPILIAYSVGIVHSASDDPSAVFFITEVNTSPWTADQIAALYAFSFGDAPSSDATTGLGLPALLVELDDATAALAWLDGAAIAVYAPLGADALGLIDAFFTANSMQG